MLLTRAADYAIRVLIHMAARPAGSIESLPTLAEATGTPVSFLSKVLQALARSGMIRSRRGKDGGFEILSKGREATLRRVVEAVDGPLLLNVCLTSGRSCERKYHCSAHPVWIEAQEALVAVLERATIQSLSGTRPGLPAGTSECERTNIGAR